MRKPERLARVLTAHVPAIAADPARLTLFVDKGAIAARGAASASLGYEVRYTLNLVVTDFAGDVSEIFVPVLAWIAEEQPQLLDRPDGRPFEFDAELLDSDSYDLEIRIELSERVAVAAVPGGWSAEALPEPARGDAFEGACGAVLWQLFLRDQLVAQTSDPDFQPPTP